MSTTTESLTGWNLANVLAEPHRREVFEAVRRARGPVTRDEVARSTGINRRLATFHLDRLADAGLLTTDYARPADRPGGPGAGRPAKRYVAVPVELELSVPSRHYDIAARLLTSAVATAPHDAENAARSAAYEEGRRIGLAHAKPGRRTVAQTRAALVAALVDLGYEPGCDGPTSVRLCNCPFRAIAELAPGLICGLNYELVAGVVEGLDLDRARVRLEPDPPNCCLTVAVDR